MKEIAALKHPHLRKEDSEEEIRGTSSKTEKQEETEQRRGKVDERGRKARIAIRDEY